MREHVVAGVGRVDLFACGLVAACFGALAVVVGLMPAAWMSTQRADVLMQQLLVCGVGVASGLLLRHRTARFGDRPGESAPLSIGPPRAATPDRRSLLRLAAGLAVTALAIYALGALAWLVAQAML